jgi:hypothetical protein
VWTVRRRRRCVGVCAQTRILLLQRHNAMDHVYVLTITVVLPLSSVVLRTACTSATDNEMTMITTRSNEYLACFYREAGCTCDHRVPVDEASATPASSKRCCTTLHRPLCLQHTLHTVQQESLGSNWDQQNNGDITMVNTRNTSAFQPDVMTCFSMQQMF